MLIQQSLLQAPIFVHAYLDTLNLTILANPVEPPVPNAKEFLQIVSLA